jgi:molybdopterin/thiamine biosynthesis adenylyltransferase/rhodanese-related sulfurtransferase
MSGRYARQILLPDVGSAGQARLAATSLLLVGAGGLGSPLLHYLVGAGVGRLTVIDHDVVAESNLHRQPLYGTADLGHPKAVAAKRAAARLNPQVSVIAIAERLQPGNAAALISEHDIAIDAADSLAVTYIMSDECWRLDRALVSASVVGWSGYVGAFCGGAPSYRAVFPDMPRRAMSCETAGVLGPAVGVLGSLQAQVVMSLVLRLQPSPLGRLTSVDFKTLRFGGFSFREALEPDVVLPFIDASDITSDDRVIDLRSAQEAPLCATSTALRVGVEGIAALTHLDDEHRTVLCCRSGLRAWHAAKRLQALGLTRLALHATG